MVWFSLKRVFLFLCCVFVGLCQVDVGKYVQVYPAEEGTQCEYWINDRFQTCIDLILDKETSNVYLLNGQYFQRGGLVLGKRKYLYEEKFGVLLRL